MPFCGYAEVVESARYETPDGRTFSRFSAGVPSDAKLVSTGFDIRWTDDGTVGRCKPPFKTRGEAEAFAADWNAKRVATYQAAGREPPPLPQAA